MGCDMPTNAAPDFLICRRRGLRWGAVGVLELRRRRGKVGLISKYQAEASGVRDIFGWPLIYCHSQNMRDAHGYCQLFARRGALGAVEGFPGGFMTWPRPLRIYGQCNSSTDPVAWQGSDGRS